MARMAQPMIESSSGTLSYGAGRQPYNVILGTERAESYGDWSFTVEEAAGWGPYAWLVTINGHPYLVDGDERPDDPGL